LLYAADERFFKETGEPQTPIGSLFHALQFLPHSPDIARHSRNGSRRCKSRLDFGRDCRFIADMNCSLLARAAVVNAAFDYCAHKQMTALEREQLSEALFWLCDGIEEELKTRKHSLTQKCLNHLKMTRHLANEMGKSQFAEDRWTEAQSECSKFIGCLISGLSDAPAS
jgi:hypothetical protein